MKEKPGDSAPSIGIIGLGPIGMTLAVHLREAGCDVMICDNDRIRINQIRNDGIGLENTIVKHQKFSNIYTGVNDLLAQNPDYVFISLKTYQVESVLKEIGPSNTSVFISAQNGIDVENMLSDKFGDGRTMRMIINFAGNLSGPAKVNVTFFNPPNYIAALDESARCRAEKIAALLNKASLTTLAVSSFEITKHAWEKTILNAALSPICGIGRFTMAEAMAFPDTTELVEQIIIEAIEVAEAEKIHFPDDFIRSCLRYLKKGGNHFPSLAGDLMNNRQTEIDYMNGKIVEYGRKHYIRTPLNLSMVNMVKAMTQKNTISDSAAGNGQSEKTKIKTQPVRPHTTGACFLGIDLGSAYTKFTVVDEEKNVVFRHLLKTLNRDKIASKQVIAAIHDEFPIRYSCATGYGRKHFPDADIIKTEINCAAMGVNDALTGGKNIIDIGGEDIKMIHCDQEGKVDNFYLNDKCAAGTGAFLTEVAERAGIEIREMSRLASQSEYSQELNSFCAVFAKTEIMKWIFDGQPVENLARGVYLSIANRIAKMKIDPSLPIVMIGGVIAYHPYLRNLLEQRTGQKITILDEPQYSVSLGAALIARDHGMPRAVQTKTADNEAAGQNL
jgi:2-dehydropantoate 2-reductase